MTSFLLSMESHSHYVGMQRGFDVASGLSDGTFKLFDQQPVSNYQLPGSQGLPSGPSLLSNTIDQDLVKQPPSLMNGSPTADEYCSSGATVGGNMPSDVKPLSDALQSNTSAAGTETSLLDPLPHANGAPNADAAKQVVDMTQDEKIDPPVKPTTAFMNDGFFSSLGALSFAPQASSRLSNGPDSSDPRVSPDSVSTKPSTPGPGDIPATSLLSQPSSPGTATNTNPNTPREAGSTTSQSTDDSQSTQMNWDSAVIRLSLDSAGRPQESKLASEELLEMCRRQGLVTKCDIPAGDTLLHGFVPVTTSPGVPGVNANQQATTPAQSLDGSTAVVNIMHGDETAQTLMSVPVQGSPQYQQLAEKMMYRNSDTKMVMMPAETFVSMRQQLEAAKADKARLVASLKSAQNACARKDEQIMDLQRRHGLLVQQYNNLQSMYQSVLTQLQQEQQQYNNSSMQLQGELQSKQQMEQLLQMLNKQLQSELQQKKAISVKLASEAASRQQLQEQLNAANAQLQHQNGNAETMQWLQSVKKRLEDDVRHCNSQLQQEQKRRNDVLLQLQNVTAEKQRLQAELSAFRSQVPQPMQSMLPQADNGLDSAAQMQAGFQMQSELAAPKYTPVGMAHMAMQDIGNRISNDSVPMMHMQPRQSALGYGTRPVQVATTMAQAPMMGYGPMSMRGGY